MTTPINEDLVSKVLTKIRKVLNRRRNSLNVPELVLLCGNLCYFIGAAIGRYTDGTAPNAEELNRMYYQKPTIDVALMLQGLLMTSWVDDHKIEPRLSNQVTNTQRRMNNE